MLRIAVISDTHGRLPDASARLLATFDEVWHLGDFCDHRTLTAVEAIGPRLTAVLGNNDFGIDLPESIRIHRAGHEFQLIHIPPKKWPDSGILLHGHTHIPRDEMIGSLRVLNPGTLGLPNKGAPASWGELGIDPDGTISWRIHPVGKE